MKCASCSETTPPTFCGRCRTGPAAGVLSCRDYQDESIETLKKGLLAAGFDFPTERSKERLFMSQGADSAVLDEANFRTMIAARAPWFKGSIGEIVWKSVVRFERRLADGFGKDRLWLAGDAAHLTGPIGIQSMNLGLAEGQDLAQTISGVLRNAAPQSSLDAYSQRWTAVWRQLHNLDGGSSCDAAIPIRGSPAQAPDANLLPAGLWR